MFNGISSTNIFPGDQDDVEITQYLGYNFNYYGNKFNTITVTDNVLIAFGPLKPAEFIVITIQQKAGNISV